MPAEAHDPEQEPDSGAPIIDPDLLALLRCPVSHAPLVLEGDRLVCYESRKVYRIEDGIPVMLVEEATELPEDEVPEEFRRRAGGSNPPA